MEARRIFVYFLIGTLGRLIPHPANVTPFTSLCLMANTQFSRLLSVVITLLTLTASNILLAVCYHYPIWGYWSIFSYTGFLMVMLMGFNLSASDRHYKVLGYLIASTLFYWVWTNFGVWMAAGLYPKTLVGLNACYIAALPFLRNSLLGNLLWTMTIYLLLMPRQLRSFFDLSYQKVNV